MLGEHRIRRATFWAVGLGIATGFALGLMAGGLWPHTPLYATATDRVQTLAIATGPVDEDVEAIYFLDFLTGDLRALVMGKNAGQFCGFFTINVAEHLGIDPGNNPHYLMVTGNVNLRRGGARMQPSQAVVYVAEATSGKVGAYAIPWNPSMAATGQKIVQKLVPVAVDQFRPTLRVAPLTNVNPTIVK
jgi:hypothetical protein